MARVTTPNGDVLDVTSPVALAYYRREPGYSVEEPAEAELVGDGSGEPLPPVPDEQYADDDAPLVGDVDEQ